MMRLVVGVGLLLTGICGCAPASKPAPPSAAQTDGPRWLAGDHHIHSRYSVGWNRETDPPTPIIAGDAIYPIGMNAAMARYYGLSWMVATDHGGPGHSRVNLELAYPELVQSRKVVPEVLQFVGLEFNTPGADHTSLIMPKTADEAQRLFEVESRFDRAEPWPADPSWNSMERMVEALQLMNSFPAKPIIFANHASRSAPQYGAYGATSPEDLRTWNDTAPEIAVGMAGAPGRQGKTLDRDGSPRMGNRGNYKSNPTWGGFDPMTAVVGGLWDSMLGEGRRWWITANSDSHINWREGGNDCWPGECSKTYVWAEKNHDSVIDGLRHGRIFVTLDDLVSDVEFTATAGDEQATIGGTVSIPAESEVDILIRFRDPATPNASGRNPTVTRVDLIMGHVTGPVADLSEDHNPTTRVVARFGPDEWTTDGEYRAVTLRQTMSQDSYIRIRGTNTTLLEPEPDTIGEVPWDDLWFYTNPIFLEVR